EAAVAEAGLRLRLEDVGELEARLGEERPRALVEVERVEVVGEGSPEEKLRREIVDALDVLLRVRLLGLRPPVDEAIAQRQGDRREAIELRRRAWTLAERVREVVQKRAPERSVIHACAVVVDEGDAGGGRCNGGRRGRGGGGGAEVT